jgi:hypothetical protein
MSQQDLIPDIPSLLQVHRAGKAYSPHFWHKAVILQNVENYEACR